jgi:exopolysaccharide biosynthesis polyprenyl glycosylphosphotransferase
VLWIAFALGGLVVLRMVVRFALMQRARRGFGLRKVILAGEGSQCLRLLTKIESHPLFGFEALAICSDTQEPLPERPDILIRTLEYLPKLVDDPEVYQVIICGSIQDQSLIMRIFHLLRDHPVDLRWVPDLSEMPLFCVTVGDFGGVPVLNLSASPMSAGWGMVKWLEDKLIAVTAIVVFAPVLLLVALAVKLSSPGPILFIQQRHGQYGKRIAVYKFRSMYLSPAGSALTRTLVNTMPRGDSLGALEPARRAGGDLTPDDFVQATRHDPRITAVGAFIRRTSLDELPQLFNVLKGEMSIVGPRPHPIKLNQQYRLSIVDLMRRHYMKPGITGLAQVSGARGETRVEADMRKRVAFDLEYIRTWSPWLDARIIIKTAIKGFITSQP